MKFFLKENWFKVSLLIIALLILISITYYFVIFLPREKVIEYQENQNIESGKELIIQQQNCANEAAKSYKDMGYSSNDIGASYTNHWSRILSRCLMEIQNTTSSSGTLVTGKDLYDVLEGKTFASFTVIRDKKLWEQKPVMCEIYSNGNQADVQFCDSETEFDAIVAGLMTN